MQTFKVQYRHGHFYELETRKRIIPVQGEEYVITAGEQAFRTKDAKQITGELLDGEKKKAWAMEKFGEGNFELLLPADTQLVFRIGNSKRAEGDEEREYIFTCRLLEDLYLFRIQRRKGDQPEDWRLADCCCKLDKCLYGDVILTEVFGKSLNELFGNIVQFYFSQQRSGATSVFNTFYKYKEGMKLSPDKSTWSNIENLTKLRRNAILKRKLKSRSEILKEL